MPLALMLLAILPLTPEPLRDSCDQIEVNHYVDSDLQENFTQTIFWDYGLDGEKRCVAWRIFRDEPLHVTRDARGWRWSWLEHGRFREERAASRLESWSTFDPEVENRVEWPMKWRRGLSQ